MTSEATGGRAHSVGAVLVRTGFTLAVVDFLWATVLTFAYGRSQVALWQGVASVPFGGGMMNAGGVGVAAGLAAHVVTAFCWSAVFLAGYLSSRALRRTVSALPLAIVVGALYGPLIWCVMSLGVMPLLTAKATAITWRWWVQLAGHAVFVGQPVVLSVRRATLSR